MNFIGLIGAGIAMGFGGVGAGIGQGMAGKGIMDAFARQPEMESKVRNLGILVLAIIETANIFNLLIAILIYVKVK